MKRIHLPFALLLLLQFAGGMVGTASAGNAQCDPNDYTTCNPCDSAISCSRGASAQPFLTGRFNNYMARNGMDRLKAYGWFQVGITGNEYGNKNTYNGPQTAPTYRNLDAFSGNTYLLGTEAQSDGKLNQVWFGLSRIMDTTHGWDWGFQFDGVYGTDARFCESFGDQQFDYGWGKGDYFGAIPQLYGEVGYKNLKARAGKFAANTCYEPLPAAYTFFYSYAYGCYSSPLTLTGGALEYAIAKNLTVLGAITTGYHSTFDNPYDDTGFFGKITWMPNTCSSLTYNIYAGKNNGFNENAPLSLRPYRESNQVMQSLIYTRKLNCRWSYMIEGHLANFDNKEMGGAGNPDVKTYDYGINQHLIYTINQKWQLGGRFEWFRTKGTLYDAAPLTGGAGAQIYETTLGLNWYPKPNLNIRPEIRYDWTDYANGFSPFDNGRETDQLSAGISMLVKF